MLAKDHLNSSIDCSSIDEYEVVLSSMLLHAGSNNGKEQADLNGLDAS